MGSIRLPFDRGAAITGLLTVMAANFLYLAGLPQILDPMMSMDPLYIAMAQLPAATLMSADPAWGPLYAVWLAPFVAVLGDPIAVYTANLYALSLGVSLLIFLYLLLLTRRAAVGVGAALFFLISDLNVPLSSKVSGFALLVVLAGLTVSELVAAGARRMSVVAIGVFVASYARPELYPAALCLCLAAIWLAYRELGESAWGILGWPATGVAAVVVAATWFGPPIGGSGRVLMAFREHFAWNWSRWHNEWRYYLSIWQQEFGDAESLPRAVLNNPGAVMHHLIDNLLGTLRFMVSSAFDHYPLLAPASTPVLATAENIVLSAVLFGGMILVLSRPGLRRQMRDSYGHVFVPYAILATFSFAAATAIYPVAHYLVVPSVLLLLTATLATTLFIPATAVASSRRTRGVAALLCLVAIPKPFVLPSAYEVPGSPFKGRITVARTVTDTVALIRSLGLAPPVHVLTVTDGIGEMIGSGFREVKVWQKGAQPLEAYMRDNDIGVIINLEGGHDSFAVNDVYWKLVHNTPEAAGFTRVDVPNNQAVRLYVRTDLMRR